MDINTPYLGETLALGSAVTWALAVILFKKTGETVRPAGLNLFKNVLAFVLFLPAFLVFRQQFLWRAPAADYAVLLLSGTLGIGVADTLFFKSLNLLGAGLSAIVDCLYSPLIIGLSFAFLGEELSALQFIGVAMIIAAVLAVSQPKAHAHLSRRNLTVGILCGVLAMACMAVGVVIMKPLLNNSPIVWVIEVRLVAGILFVAGYLLLRPAGLSVMSSIVKTKNWKYMLPGSFVGSFVALLLWMGGMKYTQTSIAGVLSQTTNVFIFILAAILLKEPLTGPRTLGIILGVLGAGIVTFG